MAVSLNINPRKSDQMLRGSVVLPGGTGKVVRVAAFCTDDNVEKAKAAGAEFAGLDDLAELIKGGETGFDVVVATPDAMRVALQLGRILGPRGLMPNPKDGTVSADIEAAITKAKAGQVRLFAGFRSIWDEVFWSCNSSPSCQSYHRLYSRHVVKL